MEKYYTLTVREYIYNAGDGYDMLPLCENIDKVNDVANMMLVCLRFFELVNMLKEDSFNKGFCIFEGQTFGFDEGCRNIYEYMKNIVVFNNGIPEVDIKPSLRVQAIEL
jgi:hypothetical protein